MKYIIIIIIIFFSSYVYGQNQYSLLGTVTEKVKLTKSGTVLEIIESYNPPKQYKLVMEPGIMNFTIDGISTKFYGTQPGHKDENLMMVFLVSSVKGSSIPEVMFMITPENDKLWMFLDNKNQIAKGFYLR